MECSEELISHIVSMEENETNKCMEKSKDDRILEVAHELSILGLEHYKLENQCEELETKYNDSCQQNQIQTLEALTLKKQITEHMDTAALLKAEIIELRAQVVQLKQKK